jgi:hypothetical protein
MTTEAKDPTLTEKANAAFRRVAAKVIERARRTGTPVIVWENGRVTARSSDDLTGKPDRIVEGDEGQAGANG